MIIRITMTSYKEIIRNRWNWFKRYWDRLLFLFVFAVFILRIPGQNIYTVHMSGLLPESVKIPVTIPDPYPYPVHTTGVFPGSEITATGVVILDANSGVYLYKRNEDMLLSPASTTKILTALVALDSYQLDDVVTVKTPANDGQVMGLLAGERMTVENLLYGALIHSGNDAAYALADHYPGGVPAFVEAMNRKAKEIHLDHSTFTNPVGYDDPAHQMTAIDLARLASVALSNKIIVKMVAIPAITISDVTHTYYHSLKNVNQLLGKIPGVSGMKTGWTENAGENLVTLFERNGRKIILVVLKSNDRFGETVKLIDWVFANYEWKTY
jgi:serine-type D-Ala-D-Ala carboxypeptidase (penicillin-binding protein 5/6)